jgi:hypothetical protein
MVIYSIWPDIWLFQYLVSRRISGKSNPVSRQKPDIKKAELSGRISGRPDIRCIPLDYDDKADSPEKLSTHNNKVEQLSYTVCPEDHS